MHWGYGYAILKKRKQQSVCVIGMDENGPCDNARKTGVSSMKATFFDANAKGKYFFRVTIDAIAPSNRCNVTRR